jgi:hypothetical protein
LIRGKLLHFPQQAPPAGSGLTLGDAIDFLRSELARLGTDPLIARKVT